jgi:hypothetical protein
MVTPCRLLVLILLLAGWAAKSPTLAFGQVTSPDPIQTEQRSEKENLEIARLRAEIEKVRAEAEKLQADRITGWLAPAVGVLSVLLLILTLVSQRSTAMRVQREQAQHALELKIADFIMSSRSPAMARQRAELLSGLYADGVSSRFLETVRAHAAAGDFPGDIGFDLRTRFFEATAAKYDAPSDIAELARRIFTGDKWLKDDLTPPKTVAQPASVEKTAG